MSEASERGRVAERRQGSAGREQSDRRPADRRLWTAAIFVFSALVGLSLQMRGAMFPSFAATFDLSEAELGLIAPVSALGYVLTLFGVGMVVGRLRVERFVALALAVAGVCLVGVGFAPTFLLLLAFVFARMVATGGFRALGRPVLSHLYPANRGRVFNFQTMAWAVGATAGPLFATFVLARGDWRVAYVVVAALFLVVAAFVSRLPAPDGMENERSLSLADVRTLLRRPSMLGLSAAMALVVGIEGGMFTWLPYYANGFLPRSRANLLLSVYLAAYVPGRLAFGAVAERLGYLRVVTAAAALSVPVLYAVVAVTAEAALFAATFCAGLLVSGLFPTLLAWATDRVPEYSGPVNAVAMTAGQGGYFVFPAVVGAVASATTMRTAMHAEAALAAALVAVLVVLRART
ncbi:MFS transporter [Halostella litorea]|uniref:MFS transporter n=1 Tax=Halostella litorea TaxID=2528831 RepID=UPI0010931244|nr:MFS transporter [Halostella litorea]